MTGKVMWFVSIAIVVIVVLAVAARTDAGRKLLAIDAKPA